MVKKIRSLEWGYVTIQRKKWAWIFGGPGGLAPRKTRTSRKFLRNRQFQPLDLNSNRDWVLPGPLSVSSNGSLLVPHKNEIPELILLFGLLESPIDAGPCLDEPDFLHRHEEVVYVEEPESVDVVSQDGCLRSVLDQVGEGDQACVSFAFRYA